MNAGNSTEQYRPTPSNAPDDSGTYRFSSMNTPYAAPNRRQTNGIAATNSSAGHAVERVVDRHRLGRQVTRTGASAAAARARPARSTAHRPGDSRHPSASAPSPTAAVARSGCRCRRSSRRTPASRRPGRPPPRSRSRAVGFAARQAIQASAGHIMMPVTRVAPAMAPATPPRAHRSRAEPVEREQREQQERALGVDGAEEERERKDRRQQRRRAPRAAAADRATRGDTARPSPGMKRHPRDHDAAEVDVAGRAAEEPADVAHQHRVDRRERDVAAAAGTAFVAS